MRTYYRRFRPLGPEMIPNDNVLLSLSALRTVGMIMRDIISRALVCVIPTRYLRSPSLRPGLGQRHARSLRGLSNSNIERTTEFFRNDAGYPLLPRSDVEPVFEWR